VWTNNLFYKCTKVHLVYCIGSKGLSRYQIYQTPVTSHQLPVNNYRWPATSDQWPVTSDHLPFTSYQSPATSILDTPFWAHFEVFCDLFLNRRTATWNLFVLCQKSLHASHRVHQAGAYPGFYSVNQLGIFYSTLDGMLVHRKVTLSINNTVL